MSDWSNREFVLKEVIQYGRALKFAHDDFKKDREIVLAAVTQNGWALRYAHDDLKKDWEVVLAAVTQDGLALQYADDDFKKDWEIVLAAVTQNKFALKYAHVDLKNSEEFLYEVDQLFYKISINSIIFDDINERIQDKIRENKDYLLDFAPVYLKPAKK
jgi:hypothetical protein